MSLSKRDFFDQPIRNVGSEAIPPFAIAEVKSPGLVTFAGREWFTVGKPSKDGKVYFVNGPFQIEPNGGTSGGAMPYRAPGVHALFKPDLDPQTNQELGPVDGQWYLGEGNGFFVVGDIRGEAASQPGLPASPATKRVRVMTTAVANETDRIQGTVAMTVTETTLAFPIQDIFVLSGKDPRPEPHFPSQSIIVQNNLKKAYVNGVDRVTSTRNKTDDKWYVETDPGGGGAVVKGTLRIDLTTRMPSVAVQVTHFSGENPADNTGAVVGWNPIDFIRPGLLQGEVRYLFCGNGGAQVTLAKMTDGKWYFLTVQPPIKPPIQPEDLP